jgi:hypothetical protein
VSAVELVRRLYEAYHARDWETAPSFLHDDATVAMPATAERLERPRRRDRLPACLPGAAFWRAAEGMLREGVEYWITVGGEEPPPERQAARPGESP